MTLKKWIGEDEFCAKIIKGASVAVLAAAALALVIGLVALLTSFDREKKRRDMGVCPAEITVLQGDSVFKPTFDSIGRIGKIGYTWTIYPFGPL